MKNLLLILLGLPLLAGCPSVSVQPDEAYVKADRAHYEFIEPVLSALADEDPDNDPDLTGVNGQAVMLSLTTWLLRIEQAESTFAEE